MRRSIAPLQSAQGRAKTMICAVRYMISCRSRFLRLQMGDIISTGMPPGVGLGQKPPVYLQPGQTVSRGIEGLGERKQRIVAA
ncbi:fumarylacetoacetate hydrolase family protein [Labrys neptuniae]